MARLWLSKNKFKFYSILIMITLSVSSNPFQSNSDIDINFTTWLFIDNGDQIGETMANYIRTALAPLGIEVKLVSKPYGLFVGDLLHQSTGHPFDMIITKFQDKSITPDFMWIYHSKSTYGALTYQVNNPDWQAWQILDSGLDQTGDIDRMIESISFERNMTKRQENLDTFAQLFMERLLYDYPLINPVDIMSMWKGFGGENNELWDPSEPVINSRALGAIWESNPSIRAQYSNTSTLSLRQPYPYNIGFDPLATQFAPELIDLLTSSLLSFDGNLNPHPNVAYNYYIQDAIGKWDDNSVLQVSEQGLISFFVGNQSYWSETTNINGETVDTTVVSATDFLFSLQVIQLDNTIVKGKYAFQSIYDANLTTTVYSDDTLNIYIKPGRTTINDFLTYGSLIPLPSHLLNTTLTFSNSSGTFIGNIWELDALGINVQDTEEWKLWSSLEGYSLNGPYDMVNSNPDGSMSFKARSIDRENYWYPNEWDVANYYNGGDKFAEFEINAENLSVGDLGRFAPHRYNTPQDAYYWAFADDPLTMTFEKPMSQGITTINYVVYEDAISWLQAFEEGRVDYFPSSQIGSELVVEHQENTQIVVKNVTSSKGPYVLIFNLLHPDLMKYNVRRAIAHAIDLDEIIKLIDGYGNANESPVWLTYDNYKPFPLDFNYALARDLMRSEGYGASYTNTYIDPPPLTTKHDQPTIPNSSVFVTPSVPTQSKEESTTELLLFKSLYFGIIILAFMNYNKYRRKKTKTRKNNTN